MRLRRLTLTDVAGISSAELVVAEHGVSVVAAPNESGKSTLLRAYQQLLSKTGYRGKTADVRGLQPVGRDVGSRIQAELVIGDETFDVDRTYNTGATSSLTVRGKTTTTFTGKEADDLLRARFLEVVDQDLYELLVFEQGRALASPGAGRSRVLVDALQAEGASLDTAAAGTGGDELLNALRRIVAASFHKTHRTPTGDLRRLKLEVEAAKARLDELERQIEQQVHGGAGSGEDLAGRLAQTQLALADTDQRIARTLAFARVTDARRLAAATAAQRKVRAEAVDALTVLATEEAALVDAAQAARVGLATLEEERKAAQAVADEVVKARTVLTKAVAQAESDLLAALSARGTELALLVKAEKVTDAVVADAVKAERAAEVAAAAVSAGSWEVQVEAGRTLDLEIDGEIVTVRKGASHQQDVSGSIAITEEDGTSLTVRADAKRREQLDTLTAARDELATILKQSDATDVAALRDRAEQRATLEEEREQVLERHAEIDNDRATAELPAPKTNAGASLDDLEDALAQAVDALENADDDTATKHVELLDARIAQAMTLIEQQTGEAARASERRELAATNLDAARAVHSDADLVTQATRAQQELDAIDTDEVEPAGEEAVLQAQRTQQQAEIEQLNRAVGAIEGRSVSIAALEMTRENLAENHSLLSSRFDRDLREAEAAARLLDRLDTARTAQGERYREPLEQRVGELLTRLYRYDCRVELDDDLRITRRSEPDGRMVEWDQLSGGAREQAAVVTGLAMAELAGDDGVPFWIDDAIVHTDDDRVEGLKELLAETTAQVIILTCRSELAQGLPRASYTFAR